MLWTNPAVKKGGAETCGGMLDAAIGVKDEAGIGLLASDGDAESLEHQIGINPLREGMSNHLSGAEVFDDGQI